MKNEHMVEKLKLAGLVDADGKVNLAVRRAKPNRRPTKARRLAAEQARDTVKN